jgi:hypothetical protein
MATLNEQLHNSATHALGSDPACPICQQQELHSLKPITAAGALQSALTELQNGFNYERFGVAIDTVDIDHFRNALTILATLLKAQQ